MMSTQVHETAKWFSAFFTSLTAWALSNGQQIVAFITAVLSLLGFVGSWWVAWQTKFGDARRKERWADAALEWQIEELRKGRIQMPRDSLARDVPPQPPEPPPAVLPEAKH